MLCVAFALAIQQFRQWVLDHVIKVVYDLSPPSEPFNLPQPKLEMKFSKTIKSM